MRQTETNSDKQRGGVEPNDRMGLGSLMAPKPPPGIDTNLIAHPKLLPFEELRSRVRGVLFGIGVGDALGLPVEMKSAKEIQQSFGRFTSFLQDVSVRGGITLKAGTTSDDTQLTIAVAEALLDSRGTIDLSVLAQAHVAAAATSTFGWGKTTRTAVERLRDGESPERSGIPTSASAGLGNGVAMKIAPIAIAQLMNPVHTEQYLRQLEAFAAMTHATDEAVASAITHATALLVLLQTESSAFDEDMFGATLRNALHQAGLAQTTLCQKLDIAFDSKLLSVDELITQLGNGVPASESVPFSLAMFLRSPHSLDSLIETVHAGGDADSTGALVGSLLGALNGDKIIPPEMAQSVDRYETLLTLAQAFSEGLEERRRHYANVA